MPCTSICRIAILLIISINLTGCNSRSEVSAKPREGKANVTTAEELIKLESNLGPAPIYTHADHFAIVRIDVAKITQQNELKEFEWQSLVESLLMPLGQIVESTSDLSEVTLLADREFFSLIPSMEDESQPSSMVIVVSSKKDFDRSQVAESFLADPEDDSIFVDEKRNQQLWFIDDRSLLVGSPEAIGKLTEPHPRNPSLMNSGRLRSNAAISGNIVISPIKSTINSVSSLAGPLTSQPRVANLLRLMNAMQRLDFSIDLSGNNLGFASFILADESMAASLKSEISETMQLVTDGADQMSEMNGQLDDALLSAPTQIEIWPKIIREVAEGGMKVTQDGKQVQVSIRRPGSFNQLLSAMVTDAKTQMAIAQRMTNAQKVAEALMQYEKENGSFPAAFWKAEEDGGDFSWRVALLPKLGHEKLYNEFNFDESWDSSHNQEVAKTIPKEFSNSHFELIGGPSGPFNGQTALTLEEVTDKPEQTALFVETSNSSGRKWHEPSIAEFDKNLELPNLGLPQESGIIAVTFDGQVRTLSRNAESGLRAVLTHNAGDRTGRKVFKQ